MDELKDKGYDQIQEYIAPYWDSTKDGFYLIESGLTIDFSEEKKEWILSKNINKQQELTSIKIPLSSIEIERVKNIINSYL